MAKKLKKKVRQLVGAGVAIGVGTAVVTKAGAPSGVTSAFGSAGRMLGPVATVVIAKEALRIVKPKKRKRLKY